MRGVVAALAALMLATPAAAGTLEELTSHGMVLVVQGMEIEVSFTPDGKLSALDGQITGAWRVDGDKLCTTSNVQPEEVCLAYPKDKKSGDSFEITSSEGTATVRIK
jgi:hypothetical protein